MNAVSLIEWIAENYQPRLRFPEVGMEWVSNKDLENSWDGIKDRSIRGCSHKQLLEIYEGKK